MFTTILYLKDTNKGQKKIFEIARNIKWPILLFLLPQNTAEIIISKENDLPPVYKVKSIQRAVIYTVKNIYQVKDRRLYCQEFPPGKNLSNFRILIELRNSFIKKLFLS